MPRSDKHNFSRRQHAAEARAANARRELDESAFGVELTPSTDWDAELAALTMLNTVTGAPLPRSEGSVPRAAPADLHKPTHRGYPRS